MRTGKPGSRRGGRASTKPFLGQYWDTEEVPSYVEELVATFRDRNPDFRHVLFSRRDAEELIANEFGPRELAAFRALRLPSMQSDYFRYCLVLAHGGVYADVGYRCVRPLRPLLDGRAGGELFLHPADRKLNGRPARGVMNGFFAFERPGHPFLRLALEIATANVEARIPERVWKEGERTPMSVVLTVGPGVFALIRWIHEWGSFDAFRRAIAGTPAEPFGDLYCEAIGDCDRLAEVFADIRQSPFERMRDWVAEPDRPLPHRGAGEHWPNVRTAIFS